MSKLEKRLNSLTVLLRTLREEGVLEPEQTKAIFRSMKRLRHAIRTKNFRKVLDAVDAIARALLK